MCYIDLFILTKYVFLIDISILFVLLNYLAFISLNICVVGMLEVVLETIWRSFGRRWEDVGKSLGRHWKVFENTLGSGL